MAETIEVAVGVLAEPSDAGWRILITRRPAGGVLAGYWEFPGGKREPTESLAACLVREFREEVGLIVQVVEPMPPVEHAYDHGHVRLCPFYCRLREFAEPTALAVSEWRWVSPASLGDYTFPPANAPLIERVRSALEPSGFQCPH